MKRVLITGGAGFLGRGIIEWADSHRSDWRFTIYSRDEGKQAKLRAVYPQHNYILGDVRDSAVLAGAVAGHDWVIHAAALKYVPEAEANVRYAVDVNVIGTKILANVCLGRVERVVGISTDKACHPVNVYGNTKLLMERLFQEVDRISDTIFSVVRYGNVVGSSGSVIPLFQRLIREGKTLNLTNPSMTRFWLGLDDAVKLVVRAAEEPTGGTVLIPRLFAATLADTATAAAMAEGQSSPQVEVTGPRFGEKPHEWLVAPHEVPYTEEAGSLHSGMPLMRLHPMTGPTVKEPIKSLTGGPALTGYNSQDADRMLNATELAWLIREIPEWA